MSTERNKRRLERNIKELRHQLEDIENAYPYGDAPKSVAREYWDLQSQHDEYLKELEALNPIKEGRIDGLEVRV